MKIRKREVTAGDLFVITFVWSFCRQIGLSCKRGININMMPDNETACSPWFVSVEIVDYKEIPHDLSFRIFPEASQGIDGWAQTEWKLHSTLVELSFNKTKVSEDQLPEGFNFQNYFFAEFEMRT